MSLVCKTLDDWLDLWEELHETGAVSDANEFLAKYVPENALAAEERNHLRGDIETLIACDRKIDKLLPKEETTYATT